MVLLDFSNARYGENIHCSMEIKLEPFLMNAINIVSELRYSEVNSRTDIIYTADEVRQIIAELLLVLHELEEQGE